MPFSKPFVDDATGATFPDAYWIFEEMHLGLTAKSVSITYNAVVNPQAALVKQPLDRAVKVASFAGPQFLALLGMLAAMPSSNDPFPVQFANLLDQLMLEFKDIPQEDGTFKSFFEDATLVPPDLSILSLQ